MEKHYEMFWDCQFCGTTKLLGKTHRFCVNCGAPQNPASRYYPSDAEKIAVEDHIFVGVDVTCPACGQLNAGGSEFCQQCGSPLKEGKLAQTLEGQTVATGTAFEGSGSRDIVKEKFDAENKPKNDDKGGISRTTIAIIVGVIGLIIFGIWFFTRTQNVTALVTGHEWERVISVQEYKRYSVESWWDIRPAGDNASMGLCRESQRSTRQIPDGESCNTVRTDRGDGTFSEQNVCVPKYRSEPVYDRLCNWQVSNWVDDRSVPTSGGLNDEPVWGEPNLNCANQITLGCERESGRGEDYNLLLSATIDSEAYAYKCPLPQNEWAEVRIETAFTLDVSVADKRQARCDTLKRAGS